MNVAPVPEKFQVEGHGDAASSQVVTPDDHVDATLAPTVPVEGHEDPAVDIAVAEMPPSSAQLSNDGWILRVGLKFASGLQNADTFSESDPYVTLQVFDGSLGADPTKFKSKVQCVSRLSLSFTPTHSPSHTLSLSLCLSVHGEFVMIVCERDSTFSSCESVGMPRLFCI